MAHCLGGGSVISDRNYELFCRIFPLKNTIRYSIEKKRNINPCFLIERCFKQYVNGINTKTISDISNIAKNCEYIWIDNSSYGAIAKTLKENNLNSATLLQI